MPLKLEIVTPEARIYSDEVDTVVLPGYEGEMGVLPAHSNLVTTLLPGELRITKGGKTIEMAVGEGLVDVAQLTNDRALVSRSNRETFFMAGCRSCRVPRLGSSSKVVWLPAAKLPSAPSSLNSNPCVRL